VEPTPSVSVIVPFHNPGAYFATLLGSLAAQRCQRVWELVLVDNRSTDDSRQLAERWAGPAPSLVVDASARAGPSYARNVGVKAARGHRLVFVDADDGVDPGYVESMDRALDDHQLVTSQVDSASLNAPWVRSAHGVPWQNTGVDVMFGFLPAAGANIGVQRGLFERLGGFSERFAASEDIAFCWTAKLQAGVTPHFVAEARYLYRYRDSLPGLLKQGVRWGRASVQLYAVFRAFGMPPRRPSLALHEAGALAAGLWRASDRAGAAPYVVRLGVGLGRLAGSLTEGVWFV